MPQDSTAVIEAIPARRVIRVSGSDARSFLQGMVTNDLARLAEGAVYTAFLSPQGKFLADFFVIPEGDALLLDVAEGIAPGLLKRLTMFKLRADVALEMTEMPVARGLGTPPEGALADPRHPDLGWRLYGTEGGPEVTDWDALRVALMIPETGPELQPDDSYILEMGFERLNGVDFKKGCYVGQEVTARMKHKTELRKGLARVQIEGEAAPGTEITANGKPAGVLGTQSGDQALAYLRFDRAKGEMTAGSARVTWTP
ncbi:YgfZ/GcvT domain-containing protein [Dinoroseobacter sp. S375]|uniref:CAF17-like 4Fe-4S cluster assembly/insertion protein YgfZ n=1 Tax=Dinoroseobacter sp. S375 TaxID=3415136 RepID=UPI003C7E94A1